MSDSDQACYLCLLCGYVYDPAYGDPTQEIAAGTGWDAVPEDWNCPMCFVPKSEFEPLG